MKTGNKRKNRLLACLMIIAILAALLAGCGEEDYTAEEVDTEIITAMYENNMSAVSHATSTADLAGYLYEWGTLNDAFRVSHDKYDNIIISKVSSGEEYSEAESTILQCTLDLSVPDRTAQAMTAAMYILSYCENHGFMRVLFTEPDAGIEKIKKSYITADNFISLDSSKNNTVITGSAERHDYKVSKDIVYQEATYTNAYEITIMGLNGTHAGKTNQLNAVKTLGKMLAELKSTGALIEIGSLCSGYMDEDGQFVVDTECRGGYPLGAQAIIYINDNDVNKLTKKITKSQTKTLDNYLEANPEMIYSFEKIEKAEDAMVISSDDTSAIISFIYTSLYGIYDKDDKGEAIAVNNILYCNTEGGHFEIDLTAISLSESKMDTLDSIVSTLCGLYDLEHEKTVVASLWDMDIADEAALKEIPLVEKICSAAFKIYEKDTQFAKSFENTAISKVVERIPDANIVAYGVTEKNLERQTATLLTYFEMNR